MYLINLGFAYLLVLPISMMLNEALTNTTAAEKLLGTLDVALLLNLLREYGVSLNINQYLLTYGLFYLVLNTFLAGGILNNFYQEQKFTLSNFINGSILFFNRFLRLMGISLLFILFIVLLGILLSQVFNALTRNATSEFWPFILSSGIFVFIGLMLILINMLFDYAKIITVYNDFLNMKRTTYNAMMFVMMSMRKTVGLYMLFFITALALLCIYWFVESKLIISSGFSVVLFFILSQIYIIFKIWLRISLFNGQFIFYKFSNTALPGMSKEMLDEMVDAYEQKVKSK
jgi:hypothetical protein